MIIVELILRLIGSYSVTLSIIILLSRFSAKFQYNQLKNKLVENFILGIVFGFGASLSFCFAHFVMGMNSMDGKLMILALAGLFFGWLPSLIAAVILTAVLTFISPFAFGFFAASFLTTIGLTYFVTQILKKYQLTFGSVSFLVFALFLSLQSYAWAAYFQPLPNTFEIIRQTFLPSLLIFCLFSLTFYQSFSNELKRVEQEKTLKETGDKLLAQNEELSALNEELSATEEELRNNYSDLVKSQQLLSEREQRYQTLFNASNEGLWDFSINKNKIFYTKQFFQTLGYSEEDTVTFIKSPIESIHPDDQPKVQKAMDDYFSRKRQSNAVEYRLRSADGSYRWVRSKTIIDFDEKGQIQNAAGSLIDINDEKINLDQISFIANYDQLTKLPNRWNFQLHFQEQLNKSLELNISGAMVFLDLDNFKVFNESFGHKFGDTMLIKISEILQQINTENLFIARLGGDEFGLLMDNIQNRNQVNSFLDQLKAALNQPLRIDNMDILISASVGVCIFPENGNSMEDLFRNVDMAMYKAKQTGRNRHVYFSHELLKEKSKQLDLETQLFNALKNGEFYVEFQPQFNLKDQRISGLETLLRWQNPYLGLVAPIQFINIAEENGLIIPIGKWVLSQAFDFCKKINTNPNDKKIVAINLSSLQIIQSDFVESITNILKESDANPNAIAFEITETLLMTDFDANINKIKQLRDMGFRISLDDFGTGYSSLNYLLRIPATALKIDKSFIDDIVENEKVKHLTKSIIEIAHHLNLAVIAEGVETRAQVIELENSDCDIIQGYYFSYPLNEKDTGDFLLNNKKLLIK
ncbi:MAG: hypothetical protein CVU39_16385 [Chloroflexi bacterium HGW-Chloroflexi-10]|nr:MAG: hypothetical protein CVU39_16385 [Chloroflexi bacterium HGW-Chloroflexi-10]